MKRLWFFALALTLLFTACGTTVIHDPGRERDTYIPETHGEMQPDSREYVLNTSSRKYHLPTCSSVGDMAEKNKQSFFGSEAQLEEMGYAPCARCMG